MKNQIYSLVDTDRYPILDSASGAYKSLAKDCVQQLRETGLCVLDGFLRPEALERARKEAQMTESGAYFAAIRGNAYLSGKKADLPADHTYNLEDFTRVGVVAYDQIAEQDVIRQVYDSPEFLKFLGDANGRGQIYYYECPLGKINYSMMCEGDYLRWHFDQSDFVVSIPIQPPETGGDYEYVYNLRSASDENYDGVRKVLEGDRSAVKVLDTPPGSLVLFEGRYTLHRVTYIGGRTTRIVALLGYADKPGVTSTEYLRQIRYGRVK